MSETFESLAEKRANERAEETRLETLFNSIKNLIAFMKWTAEQAMTALNISENDQVILKAKFYGESSVESS